MPRTVLGSRNDIMMNMTGKIYALWILHSSVWDGTIKKPFNDASQYKYCGKKIKLGSNPRGTVILYRFAREDFTVEITFDPRPEWNEKVSPDNIWRKSLRGRGRSKSELPWDGTMFGIHKFMGMVREGDKENPVKVTLTPEWLEDKILHSSENQHQRLNTAGWGNRLH